MLQKVGRGPVAWLVESSELGIMSRIVAIQMDPIDSIDISTDATFVLGLEAQRRGYLLYHYQPHHLSLAQGRLIARGHPMELFCTRDPHWRFDREQELDLDQVDLVLMRQDPPFDLAYITATHLLEHITQRVLVVNDPCGVRNAPEKLLVTHFGHWMPPTLISADRKAILEFKREWQDVVIKPLYGAMGRGVLHLSPDDQNIETLLEMIFSSQREPVVVQKFLPEIRQGDKRITLVEGQPAGVINRIPGQGSVRANLHAGGSKGAAEITDREQAICAELGPVLRQRGLLLVGIDIIGGYLNEINVTCPGCLRETNQVLGCRIEEIIFDAIESRLAARSQPEQ